MSMTPRERWLAVVKRDPPDQLPVNYRATTELTRNVLAHTGCADRWEFFRRFDIDYLHSLALRYIGRPLAADTNEFGCTYRNVPHEGGVYRECVGHPLAHIAHVEQLQREYRWPTADEYDYDDLRRQVAGREAYPVVAGGSEPFLTYTELRGMALAYRDLLTNPELVHHCLDKLFDLAYEQTRRVYETLPGRVDFSYVAEDLGGQQDLLFSPGVIRTYFLPRMQRMVTLAHAAGVRVFCHSDGAIRRIIPDLIDLGVDVLDPIQWRCAGMDRAALKRDFGKQVVFHGGMDNQHTMAFGSVADVRTEVYENIATLGAGGGYILGPCHALQVISPPGNVVAMYQAARWSASN